MEWLKNLDLRHWWIAVVASGIAFTTAAIAAQFVPMIFLGLGLLLFGIGEWIDHPIQTQLGPNFKVTSYPRHTTVLGFILDAVGIGLMCVGLYKLTLL